MEAKSCRSAELLSSDCSSSDLAENTNAAERATLTSDHNITEDRESTKTILEDVCTDFESMDVINPKSNKICVIKKPLDTSLTKTFGGKRNSEIGNVPDKTASPGKSVEGEVASPVVREVPMSTQLKSETNSQLDAGSAVTETEPVQQSSASIINSETDIQSNSEILPSNNCQNPSNIAVLSESFAGEEHIPLAQLADAEIVQTGDNVSIFVTNTRLIKVLTNANNSESPVQSVIDPTGMILETSGGTAEQIGIIDPTVLTDSSFQSINILDDSSVINEAVISDSENLSTSIVENASTLTEDQLNALRKHSTPKGRPAKKAFRRSYAETGSSTKARRITAKMKTEWTRQLEETGRIVCEMPGCSQTYVTIANFQTHYKYCTGKKSLQHCLYCDSLIFSSHKAVLHHMEVEHPEKVEEYKAQFPEESTEFEEDEVPPQHLIVAEDENVAMNVEEVTQQPQKNYRKRKLSSKENVASKRHCILKHKMQSIQNTVTENIKEFKKCVRFGDIVDKINSVDIAKSLELPTDNQSKGLKQKKERRRIILTESIVAEKKYFEDDEDDLPSKESIEHPQINPEKLNTKARMLLNMERYKRYKEYLKLTRDWSSERRTYSRSRTSDTSFDSSYLMALQNEYIQDTHQLNDTAESSSISLNTSETEINPNVSYLQAFEVLEENQFASPVAAQPDAIVNEPPVSTTSKANESSLISSNELTLPETPVNASDKSHSFEPVLKREKTACYNRPSLSNVQIKSEALRAKPAKFEGIITYGMTVPGPVSKSIEPVVTFDSLISSVQQKQDRRNSCEKGTELVVGENTSQKQVIKEDGIKQPGDALINSSESPKKKRGRPPKPKPDLSLQQKVTSDSKNKIEKEVQKNNAKKFSTAMLKSIEKNVKKRHAKLFKKNSKFKTNSKRSGKNTQLLSRHSNLKTIQKSKLKRKLIMAKSKNIQKNLKRSLLEVNTIISKQEMHGKGDSAEESMIQCQENIDNHLLLGNEPDTRIKSLVTEHNYSNIINSVIEDHLLADANNVATEIEVITSTIENAPASHEEKQKVENANPKVIANISDVTGYHELDNSEVNQQLKDAALENITNVENAPVLAEVNQSEVNQKFDNAIPDTTSIVENVPAPSETNQTVTSGKAEIVTPEVKVKRPRGRPRKNQNKEATPDASVTLNPVQNASNIINADKTVGSNDDVDLQSSGETPNSAVSQNKSSSVRKSERVKRRKLVDDEIFESPKVEAKKKEEEAVLVIRTGRRGRPRKVYPKDSEVSMTSNKIAAVAEKSSEIESGSADEKLRKYSRKGRPRKCVRYADLNSGVDSSESLDGLNSSVKDKTEIHKTRGDKSKKSLDSERGEKENSESNNTSHEQDENIVLPLKKRKQRQSKKDDSLQEDASSGNTTKDTADPEIILDEEENMKRMEIDSEDDDRKGKSRNLRNYKNSKVSPRRRRIRHDSSDLENELSSYINSRNDASYTAPITRRKSSNVDLLELEDETSDIEKNDADVSSRKDTSKRLNDSSLINRRVSARSVARSKELKDAALKDSFQSAVNVLSDFKPQKYAWKLLSGNDYYDFSPPMKYSPYFKIEKTWTGSETNWTSLSVFDSMPIDRESCHGTFFTGGPVLCAAWCPTPAEDKKVQFVALAISCSLDKYHSYVCTDPEKGLLQLWNVGPLHDKMLNSKPVMELSIAHNHGLITEMAWCPNGCWEDPSTECSGDAMPRLGMLAVACSDSNIRIYSIPHPSFLTNESSFPMYESCPSIVLQPMYGEICCVTRKSMCISLSWQKYDNCERVAAGYGNGMICIWRINTSATILISKESNQTKISPYLVFNAHGTPVTSVCFAPLPGGRFLVSSSSDKTLKFWDLTDISMPFFTVKKGAARSAEWAHHYCGAFASLDHGMNCFKGSSFFKECGTENFPSRLLSNPSCFVMKSIMSEFLNAQAIADMSGTVSVSFTHSLLQEHVKSPQYFHRPVYLTERAVVEGIIEKIAFSSYPESSNCIAAIQEMKDIISVMSKVTQECTGEKKLDSPVTENEPLVVQDVPENTSAEDSSENVSCLHTILEMKDVVSVLMEVVERSENLALQEQDSSVSKKCDTAIITEDSLNKETLLEEMQNMEGILNDKISEMADIVTVVTDMKDIAVIVDELAVSSEDSTEEIKVSCCVKPVADVSSETVLMEVDGESESNLNSCLVDQVPLLLENESDSRVSEVENFCTESVACVSTVLDMKDIVSVVNHVIDICEKVDSLGISLQPNDLKAAEEIETQDKFPCESDLVLMADSEKLSPNSVENIASVIQGMKDVVCTLSGLVTESSEETNVNLKELSNALVDLLKKQTSDERNDEKWIVQGTGLPFELSEMTDIVSTVMDLRDITVAMEQLMNIHKETYPVKHQPLSLSELNDTSLQLQSDGNTFDQSHSEPVAVVSSDINSEKASVSGVSTDENILQLETSAVLDHLIKLASEEVDNEQEIKKLLREMIKKITEMGFLKRCEIEKQKSSVSAVNILESEDIDFKPTDISNELITAKPSTEVAISNGDGIQCNNYMSLPPSFDQKQLELMDDDEPMLSADGESSNSENEMDTDDEREGAGSYVYDQKSGFSDDSYMSECSLDSNISMCSFSCESDLSENSLDSVPGDQEINSSVFCSNSQNNTVEDSQIRTDPPLSSLNLVSEISQNLPSTKIKDDPKSIGMDSTATNLLNTQDTESRNHQIVTSPSAEEIVPSSSCQDADTVAVNMLPVSDESSKIDDLEISMRSETSDEMPSETCNVSDCNVAVNDILVNSESYQTDVPCASNVLSVEKSCDINTCSTEISENVDIPCTENSDKNLDNFVNMPVDKTSQNDCSVLPKTTEKNIFDLESISETVVNSDHCEDNEENTDISIVETTSVLDKKSFSPESLSSYENVISQYGLVFKDMNTAQFENVEDTCSEERDSLDQYQLASVKTIAWNPNYGSHFWLFSAGQSGIARISYISDINECKNSKRKDGKDA